MSYSSRPPTELGVRDMFTLVLMFLDFLRADEVACLRFQDVWVSTLDGARAAVLYVYIEKSKTDQARPHCRDRG